MKSKHQNKCQNPKIMNPKQISMTLKMNMITKNSPLSSLSKVTTSMNMNITRFVIKTRKPKKKKEEKENKTLKAAMRQYTKEPKLSR